MMTTEHKCGITQTPRNINKLFCHNQNINVASHTECSDNEL